MQDFELTAKQEEVTWLLGGEAKHVMLFGGSRSGKTFAVLRAMALRALKAPGSRQAVLRFRFNHCKQSVVMDTWPKMLALCFPELKGDKAPKMNKSDWFCEFSNGAQIWFGGLDDSDKVLGNEYAGIFLNECSQISWEARNLVMTRLAQSTHDDRGPLKLKMYYDLNPALTSHWSHKLFIDNRDPVSKQPIRNAADYVSMQVNPGDNLTNLPSGYLDTLRDLPARLQKRFLEGSYSDANADSLFDDVTFDKWRALSDTPDMQRIVIAVDPSGASSEDSDADAIGIIVAGIGVDGNCYLLEDLTLKAGPATWGAVVSTAFERHGADMVVGEANYGGSMVEHVIQSARHSSMQRLPYKAVTATRGKVVRAEPISALVEKGKVRHVGYFPELEDELAGFTTHGYTGGGSPNRADAYVWAITYLFPGLTKSVRAETVKKTQHDAMPVAGGWMGA